MMWQKAKQITDSEGRPIPPIEFWVQVPPVLKGSRLSLLGNKLPKEYVYYTNIFFSKTELASVSASCIELQPEFRETVEFISFADFERSTDI